MGTLFAQQSMPHEKRAPLGYLAYPISSTSKHAEPKRRDLIGSASSATTETFSDSSSQFSWRPLADQSSAQTTPDSLSSYDQSNQCDGPSLGALQKPVHAVDVPSWREGVEQESQNSASVLPLSQRQNARRTGPACRGTDSRQISPPSTLVRQPERRHCFVSCLVVFAAGLIAAIWPLSAPVLHDTSYAHNVLPLQDFITETLRRSKTSYSTLQVAMYYLILLKAHLPKCDFTQEQSCVPADRRPMQCGRRMFLSALMLASKFLQDRNYSTRAWGKITGLPTSEINTNELKFLEAVNWKLHVSKEKFERWSHTVIALSAPPKPGMSLIPQPSLVETLGWSTVLDRLSPDCLDDFSQFRDGSALPSSLCYQTDSNGMLTPPSSPPDSTISDQEDSTSRSEINHDPVDVAANESSCAFPAPPPAPFQHNLPTPRGTPSLRQYPASLSGAKRSTSRCRESSSAMAMLKLCARPANRTLCPPPSQRPFQRADQPCQPAISRRSSMSSSTSSLSSPESVRSDLSSVSVRSRSSSISSAASSVLGSSENRESEFIPGNVQLSAGTQRYVTPPKFDCSSTLRPEEYSAADALLRFHEVRQSEFDREQIRARHADPTKTALLEPSKHSPNQVWASTRSTEKNKKKKNKRTHSKSNISDLLNIPEDDLQAQVRKNLMLSSDHSGNLVPEVDSRDAIPRQCKRTRSTKEQLSSVDFARMLLKEKKRENRPLSSKCCLRSER